MEVLLQDGNRKNGLPHIAGLLCEGLDDFGVNSTCHAPRHDGPTGLETSANVVYSRIAGASYCRFEARGLGMLFIRIFIGLIS
jgi:hypothetical protein